MNDLLELFGFMVGDNRCVAKYEEKMEEIEHISECADCGKKIGARNFRCIECIHEKAKKENRRRGREKKIREREREELAKNIYEARKEVAEEVAKKKLNEIKDELKIPSRYIPNKKKIKSQLWREQKGKCAICGEELSSQEFHIDHIFPYCDKSEYPNGYYNINEKENLRLLCENCNWIKGNKKPIKSLG